MAKSNWMKDEDQKGNFSNQKKDTFDPGKNYLGLRLQQGVPLLDRDWNELEDIRRHAEVMLRKYYIGNGVPDENSFKITAADPPANDFKIAAGRCLVDGFEAVNGASTLLYSQQEDVGPLNIPTAKRVDTVYLDVWIEEVTCAQDSALKNPQDVDMETSIRHKLEWRVRVDEGGKGYVQEAFHHYYPVAKIHRYKEKDPVEPADIEDLRRTGLSLYLIKKGVFEDKSVTRASIADGAVNTVKLADSAVTNAKLNDGSVNEDKISAAARAKLVTNGNNHNHSGGDGGTIHHSSLSKDDGTNPHGTTAQDVGALPITGGTVNGDIVASGKITSQNSRVFASADNHIQATKNLTHVASTWEDMPDMSIEITTGNSSLLVLFNVGEVHAVSERLDEYSEFRLLIDKQQKCYRKIEKMQFGDVSFSWVGPITEGKHNIKVQWQLKIPTANAIFTSSSLNCCNGNSTRSLMAIEL